MNQPVKAFCFLITILVYTAISFKSYSQKTFHLENCDFDIVFTKTELPAGFGKDSTDLQKFFFEKMEVGKKNIKGDMEITAIIDSLGKACWEYVENNSNYNVEKKLREILNSMPSWKPAFQNGRTVTARQHILLHFENHSLTATCRMG